MLRIEVRTEMVCAGDEGVEFGEFVGGMGIGLERVDIKEGERGDAEKRRRVWFVLKRGLEAGIRSYSRNECGERDKMPTNVEYEK